MCFLFFPASSRSAWVIWAYESPKTAILPRPKSTHFCTPTHLSCALCLCVLSLEMTPSLSLSPSSSSFFFFSSSPLCWFLRRGEKKPKRASVPPSVLQLPQISWFIFTTLEMSCFYGWWVKTITHQHFYMGLKNTQPLCYYFLFFSALNGNLPRYTPHFFFFLPSLFLCCEVECFKRKCSIWLGSYWPCYSQALSTLVVFS